MSEALRGVVVCHGGVAAALIDAVVRITGPTDRLIPVSNTGCDRGLLEQRIDEAIGDRPAVVFVDMPSGSCMFAVLRRLHDRPSVKVVTGVNLAMLLDFVMHTDASAAEAVARAVASGEKAIRAP
ncbi:MAG TPA: hypothetical protein VFV65_06605 [Gemmatimonadales bacterium]|nr:hypothetical protein [Gemmatimonadales bacterium]